MIATRRYQLVPHQDTPAVPAGISLNVPILRKRTLREAALTAVQVALLGLVHTALGLENSCPAAPGQGTAHKDVQGPDVPEMRAECPPRTP
jgi:hypothetical protein